MVDPVAVTVICSYGQDGAARGFKAEGHGGGCDAVGDGVAIWT